MSLLSATAIDYSIDQVPILKGIDFHVDKGELVGLIGPNGAGKSSLLRLLTGIEAPDRGEIRLQDQGMAKISSQQRARWLGYLVQGAQAYWPFSVEKVVGLGRIPYQKWWQQASAEDQAKIEAAMEMTETLAYRNRIVTTLSGGEQTLVMLARIFATGNQLILADEPVAALDPYHQLHVMEILRQHAQQDRAAVVVLHDLSLAARFCDRLYMLSHGELECSGSVDRVLNKENIARVYGVDSRIECNENSISVIPLTRVSEHHP
ncbi:MAG: ABC transporter ATP-binding protein [Gammaproteobacteria bacterium]|nr:ABC transporter ATP-binding protein [Gammaproteobacteria bacterium]MDH3859225.1 ABC transporter ATP-binding protein [Gammaproteobacteria bacterium]